MKNKYLIGIFLCLTLSFSARAQESEVTTTSPFKVTADVVSSYVWRGVLSTLTPTPNFQPTLAYVNGGLELGAWGSTDFTGSYKEADLYVSYTKGPLKVTITDYYWFNTTTAGLRYFNYKNSTTNHIFEGSVGFSGPSTLPVYVSANVMFAGMDKKFDALTGTFDPEKQSYSTYIELGYAFSYFTPFLGITPADGYYGDGYGAIEGFGAVNLGFSSSRSLKITDDYSLPLKAVLGFNPQKEDIYLVFGLTF